MSDLRDTVTSMWLFIEGQNDPIPSAEHTRGQAVGDYWYNLDTGATVFLTAEQDAGADQKTGRLRVWATSPGGDRQIEVTRPLTGEDWPYVESMNEDKNYEGTLKAATAKLNQVLAHVGA